MTGTIPALGAIDWRAVLALSGILAAVFLLVYWNNRGDTHRGAQWLGHSALSLEALGLALSLFWAAKAPDGAILPFVFCAGWVGMLIGRAVLITHTVHAAQRQRFGFVTGAVFSLTVAYAALYGSGLFHAVNDAGDAAQSRLEQSRPALALDAEIESARARLQSLAGFADASRAHNETEAAASANAALADQRRALSADLAAARSTLSNCNPTHKTRCVRPAEAEIARISSLLSDTGGSVGSDYAARHAEYNGLQAHLVDLQKQRAALSETGGGVVSQWKPEDNMLAWLFGITPEQASRVKWLVATAIFDALSLLFRIFGALSVNRADPETMTRRKLDALLTGGFDVQEALAVLTGGASATVPHAVVSRPHLEPAPALDTGGRIHADGLAHVHSGEAVLNAAAVATLDSMYPGLVDTLNAGGNVPAGTRAKPMSGAGGQAADTAHTDNCAGCEHLMAIGGGIMCGLNIIKGEFTAKQSKMQACEIFRARAKPVMPKEANDYKPMTTKANDYKPMTTKANGLQVINCEQCGAEVKQRTVWQRFCPDCSATRKAGVLKARAKKPAK